MLNDLEKKTPSVPVTPVPAATVMVLRDTPSGIEVLMVQRTKNVTGFLKLFQVRLLWLLG